MRKKQFKMQLPLCPCCGMDSGQRVMIDIQPPRYFVVCETCGHRTKEYGNQSAATKEWSGKI